MLRVFIGATLLVAGIAGFIEAAAHKPECGDPVLEFGGGCRHSIGLSSSAYDVLRIGSWALVIFGALLVLIGLMRYWILTRKEAQ